MSSTSDQTFQQSTALQGFEQISSVVLSEFRVQESLLDNGVPTYLLAQPQETKQAFLRLLPRLKQMNLIALLRRIDGKLVLRVVSKPPVKPSNVLINWVLFFATMATTFAAGYLLSPAGIVSPLVGGATFSGAILAVLGIHEMGHKITANREGVDATAPYFIPAPPPLFIGTFGAVIMQKSLPPNKDALFDIGADGPISGFIVAIIVSIVGLALSSPTPSSSSQGGTLGAPILWYVLEPLMRSVNIFPTVPNGYDLLLHPIAFAGWVGMLVTTLNLLPVAMLDGGHVVRSVLGDRLIPRIALAVFSIGYLVAEGLLPMAFLVMFMLFFRHPGPMDDVSNLSTKRKLVALGLVGIFVLCFVPLSPIL